MKSRTFFLSAFLLFCFSALTLPLYAKEGAVECGNLIYAGTKTSKCFSDEFLTTVQQKTSIATERRFKAVKLADDELFKIPFVIMTGESDFNLTAKERANLKKYLENGGFLLASASCSNEAWSKSFERELKSIFGNDCLKDIPLNHDIFRTVFSVKDLKLSHSGPETLLKGFTHNGKIVVVYSAEGLNDSSHAEGCCCCGGNEIQNSMEINANILAYALLH
ncbi:MAG: DUF4159 domain-containing protein [Verrucomicrobiota bacterium]